MTLYRKRPIVIEAIKFRDNVSGGEVLRSLNQRQSELGKPLVKRGVSGEMFIPTPEGVIVARPGDWIIRGVAGELYPCKPDIFTATYEAVDEPDYVIAALTEPKP